jgi:hypothetical protein
MSAHGNSIEEDFEVVKFIENNTPFTILLGKPWIERDQARRKEEEVLEKKMHKLKYFMTRRIAQMIEEQENRSKYLKMETWMSKLKEHKKSRKRLKHLPQIKKKYFP